MGRFVQIGAFHAGPLTLVSRTAELGDRIETTPLDCRRAVRLFAMRPKAGQSSRSRGLSDGATEMEPGSSERRIGALAFRIGNVTFDVRVSA
jgi:hypothetical protein